MTARLPDCLRYAALRTTISQPQYVEVLAATSSFSGLGGRLWLTRAGFETMVNAGARFTVLRESDSIL